MEKEKLVRRGRFRLRHRELVAANTVQLTTIVTKVIKR